MRLKDLIASKEMVSEILEKVNNNVTTVKDYREIIIPKASGGKRVLYEPKGHLKDEQSAIAGWLKARFLPSPFATAYVNNRNILTNAITHIYSSCIIGMDLLNFFGNITPTRFLMECGLTSDDKDYQDALVNIIKKCFIK